jgi:hypothetical protein
MALWPIFRVARFSRTNLSMIVARALKIGQIADGGMPPTYETTHQCTKSVTGIAALRAKWAAGQGATKGHILVH